MSRKLAQTTVNKFKKKLLAEQKHGGSMAFELEKELTLDENTKHLLTQIEHALVLIKKKKYGNCESCGSPIPVARLEALPYSTNCKDCAALIDS